MGETSALRKALLIGLKDLRVAARDRAALLLMLAAPFILTLGLGLVSGSFGGGGNSGIQQIPVAVVNEDGGRLGRALVDAFSSEALDGLLAPAPAEDAAAARAAVEADEVAAAVIIPAGFTESVIPAAGGALADPVAVELYANPARPISSGVVAAVVEQFLGEVEAATVAGRLAVSRLLESGLLDPAEVATVGQEIGEQAAAGGEELVAVAVETVGGDEEEEPAFNPLAILAPAMAIFFLMYTVTYGGRSLLEERAQWTLQRLLTTPTASASVLAGKVIGIVLTGVAQLLILIFGTTLLFGLEWGAPLALVVLIVATVLGASGWGLLLAAVARTPFQVSNVGTAMMLLFGILGGSFIPAAAFPTLLQQFRLITPNAWALDAMEQLALGAGLAEIRGSLLALLLMALLLGAAAAALFRRRQVAG